MSFILHAFVCVTSIMMMPLAQCEQIPLTLPSAVVLPEVLDQILNTIKPTMTDILQAQFPASIGRCKDRESPAPQPCEEIGDLATQKSGVHRVRARWIGIMNLARVETLAYVPAADNANPNRFGIQLGLRFPELPLSLKVQACVPLIGCTTILDNVGESCCGREKLLLTTMVVTCHEDGLPFLRAPALASVSITPPMEVKVKGVKVKDITSDVERQLQGGLEELLTQGLLGDLNREIQKMVGHEIVCSRR